MTGLHRRTAILLLASVAACTQGPRGDVGPRGPEGVQGATGPQGPSGPTGPTGVAGPALVVVDSPPGGAPPNVLGPLVGYDQATETVSFFNGGIIWPIAAGNGAINYPFPLGSTFFFETTDCTGTAWVDTGTDSVPLQGPLCQKGAGLLGACKGPFVLSGGRLSVSIQSRTDPATGACQPQSFSGPLSSVRPSTTPVNALNLPLVVRER